MSNISILPTLEKPANLLRDLGTQKVVRESSASELGVFSVGGTTRDTVG